MASKPCTTGELESFVRAALPGHNLVYFSADHSSGYHGLDLTMKTAVDREYRELCQVINRVRTLANAGVIDLVQRRPNSLRTEYVAIWRRHNRERMPDHLALPMVLPR